MRAGLAGFATKGVPILKFVTLAGRLRGYGFSETLDLRAGHSLGPWKAATFDLSPRLKAENGKKISSIAAAHTQVLHVDSSLERGKITSICFLWSRPRAFCYEHSEDAVRFEKGE